MTSDLCARRPDGWARSYNRGSQDTRKRGHPLTESHAKSTDTNLSTAPDGTSTQSRPLTDERRPPTGRIVCRRLLSALDVARTRAWIGEGRGPLGVPTSFVTPAAPYATATSPLPRSALGRGAALIPELAPAGIEQPHAQGRIATKSPDDSLLTGVSSRHTAGRTTQRKPMWPVEVSSAWPCRAAGR
jgi:hypothetical protein